MRHAFSEEAIDRLMDLREQTSRENYLRGQGEAASLRKRVARLALIRSQVGYMTDYEELAD